MNQTTHTLSGHQPPSSSTSVSDDSLEKAYQAVLSGLWKENKLFTGYIERVERLHQMQIRLQQEGLDPLSKKKLTKEIDALKQALALFREKINKASNQHNLPKLRAHQHIKGLWTANPTDQAALVDYLFKNYAGDHPLELLQAVFYFMATREHNPYLASTSLSEDLLKKRRTQRIPVEVLKWSLTHTGTAKKQPDNPLEELFKQPTRPSNPPKTYKHAPYPDHLAHLNRMSWWEICFYKPRLGPIRLDKEVFSEARFWSSTGSIPLGNGALMVSYAEPVLLGGLGLSVEDFKNARNRWNTADQLSTSLHKFLDNYYKNHPVNPIQLHKTNQLSALNLWKSQLSLRDRLAYYGPFYIYDWACYVDNFFYEPLDLFEGLNITMPFPLSWNKLTFNQFDLKEKLPKVVHQFIVRQTPLPLFTEGIGYVGNIVGHKAQPYLSKVLRLGSHSLSIKQFLGYLFYGSFSFVSWFSCRYLLEDVSGRAPETASRFFWEQVEHRVLLGAVALCCLAAFIYWNQPYFYKAKQTVQWAEPWINRYQTYQKWVSPYPLDAQTIKIQKATYQYFIFEGHEKIIKASGPLAKTTPLTAFHKGTFFWIGVALFSFILWLQLAASYFLRLAQAPTRSRGLFFTVAVRLWQTLFFFIPGVPILNEQVDALVSNRLETNYNSKSDQQVHTYLTNRAQTLLDLKARSNELLQPVVMRTGFKNYLLSVSDQSSNYVIGLTNYVTGIISALWEKIRSFSISHLERPNWSTLQNITTAMGQLKEQILPTNEKNQLPRPVTYVLTLLFMRWAFSLYIKRYLDLGNLPRLAETYPHSARLLWQNNLWGVLYSLLWSMPMLFLCAFLCWFENYGKPYANATKTSLSYSIGFEATQQEAVFLARSFRHAGQFLFGSTLALFLLLFISHNYPTSRWTTFFLNHLGGQGYDLIGTVCRIWLPTSVLRPSLYARFTLIHGIVVLTLFVSIGVCLMMLSRPTYKVTLSQLVIRLTGKGSYSPENIQDGNGTLQPYNENTHGLYQRVVTLDRRLIKQIDPTQNNDTNNQPNDPINLNNNGNNNENQNNEDDNNNENENDKHTDDKIPPVNNTENEEEDPPLKSNSNSTSLLDDKKDETEENEKAKKTEESNKFLENFAQQQRTYNEIRQQLTAIKEHIVNEQTLCVTYPMCVGEYLWHLYIKPATIKLLQLSEKTTALLPTAWQRFVVEKSRYAYRFGIQNTGRLCLHLSIMLLIFVELHLKNKLHFLLKKWLYTKHLSTFSVERPLAVQVMESPYSLNDKWTLLETIRRKEAGTAFLQEAFLSVVPQKVGLQKYADLYKNEEPSPKAITEAAKNYAAQQKRYVNDLISVDRNINLLLNDFLKLFNPDAATDFKQTYPPYNRAAMSELPWFDQRIQLEKRIEGMTHMAENHPRWQQIAEQIPEATHLLRALKKHLDAYEKAQQQIDGVSKKWIELYKKTLVVPIQTFHIHETGFSYKNNDPLSYAKRAHPALYEQFIGSLSPSECKRLIEWIDREPARWNGADQLQATLKYNDEGGSRTLSLLEVDQKVKQLEKENRGLLAIIQDQSSRGIDTSALVDSYHGVEDQIKQMQKIQYAVHNLTTKKVVCPLFMLSCGTHAKPSEKKQFHLVRWETQRQVRSDLVDRLTQLGVAP